MVRLEAVAPFVLPFVPHCCCRGALYWRKVLVMDERELLHGEGNRRRRLTGGTVATSPIEDSVPLDKLKGVGYSGVLIERGITRGTFGIACLGQLIACLGFTPSPVVERRPGPRRSLLFRTRVPRRRSWPLSPAHREDEDDTWTASCCDAG